MKTPDQNASMRAHVLEALVRRGEHGKHSLSVEALTPHVKGTFRQDIEWVEQTLVELEAECKVIRINTPFGHAWTCP